MPKSREALAPGYIMEALLILMESMSYHSISISAICQKAGVARTTFYRNFSSKEDMLAGWIDQVTDQFLAASNIRFKADAIEEYFILLIQHMYKYRSACIQLERNGLLHLVRQKFDTVFLEKYGDELGFYTCAFFSGAVFGVYYLWLKEGGTLLPEQLASQIHFADLLHKSREPEAQSSLGSKADLD